MSGVSARACQVEMQRPWLFIPRACERRTSPQAAHCRETIVSHSNYKQDGVLFHEQGPRPTGFHLRRQGQGREYGSLTGTCRASLANAYRDEDLIAHGWPEDVWFHVDNLSSAHIYLRLRADQGETWDAIPQALLTDCAQLTKANSIEGNKKDNITVIYTPWSNLKKTGDMATGQVGFKDHKMVRRCYVEKRENVVVNRLNKTKVEKYPDLRQEKADRERDIRRKERIAAQDKVGLPVMLALPYGVLTTLTLQKKQDQRIAEERAQLKYQKDHMYDDLHTEDNMEMSSNQDRDADFYDDFM